MCQLNYSTLRHIESKPKNIVYSVLCPYVLTGQIKEVTPATAVNASNRFSFRLSLFSIWLLWYGMFVS